MIAAPPPIGKPKVSTPPCTARTMRGPARLGGRQGRRVSGIMEVYSGMGGFCPQKFTSQARRRARKACRWRRCRQCRVPAVIVPDVDNGYCEGARVERT
jgi:hypothetical protein